MLEEPLTAGQQILVAIIGIVYLVFSIWGCWKIARKAGYPPWWGLVMIVPLVNLILFFYFAFAEWPIQRELKNLKR